MMGKPTDKQVRKIARALCKAHDRHLCGTNEHGALIAYDAGSFAVPYWEALARKAYSAAVGGQHD